MQIRKTRQVRSAKTAIARKGLSAPAKFLFQQNRLEGRILDFGCGRGDVAQFLDGDIEQWDPNWHPKRPRGKFDTVTCIYVLNVLRDEPRREALADAKSFVRKGGRLYVAVRRDLDGDTGTKKWGTEQYDVRLRLPSFMRKVGAFEIYEWRNE